eukprot:jgi/Psemu1/35149/gm1.35149_g
MPKKRRTAGGTRKPQTNKNRKKTLLAQERREVTRIHQEDDETRPSPRAVPRVNYEEVPTDDEEEYAYVDPEAYTESPPARVATSYKRIRQSIALIFENALETPPAEDWKELNTISFICDCFKNDRRAFRDTVIQVCTDVLYCQDNGIFYSGKGNYSTTGRPPIIALDSIEAEIVADSIESGNSVRMSTVIVNKYRKKLELPSFTYSAVRGCMLRLNPLIKTVKRGKQGSKTKEDAWCRASFRWFAQLLLRFGKIDFSHAIFPKLLGEAYVENQPPPCYDVALLSPLKLSRIVWFDEIHKQCHIGQSGSRIGPGRPNVAISFKRNEFGKLDPNGEYAASDKSVLQVKYEREARFCLGVFMTDDDKGHRVDEIFEYTEKKLITRPEREKLRLQVIAYAKTQKGMPSKVWIRDDRPPGAIYGNESVQQIPKLKGKTFQKLQQHGLVLVRDLKALSSQPDRIRAIAAATPGISFNRLSGFAHAAAICLEADNPYESLYGRSWKEEVDKVCMVGKVCVTEMIDYMFDQTKRIFGDEGFVYHDALVLMTCADSVSYMKEKGYYKHWILPELDLTGEQGGVGGSLKLYRNRPVGNRPEANPLDTSLFSQLNRAVDQHVVLTQGFIDENKKFSLATPTAVSRTYRRVWTLHPKSETIVKDINKVLCSFLEVAEAEGIAIDGIGDRSGRRHLPRGQHEGRGVQKLDIDCYDKGEIELHEDAEDAGDLILAKAEAKFNV